MAEALSPQWTSPIPKERWDGFRRVHKGVEAFQSLSVFEEASKSELENALNDHERQTLGRLLSRGKKDEIELFIRTHGANPLSDPETPITLPLFAAKADVVNLADPSTEDANKAILNGEAVHVLFQAGEASRFSRGPLFSLNPLEVACDLGDDISRIEAKKSGIDKSIYRFLAEGPLGPKQPVLIRAALRRVIYDEIAAGRLTAKSAAPLYKDALAKQKILFFVGRQGGVNQIHDAALRQRFEFYGFNPAHIVTVEQELAKGLTANEDGAVSLMEEESAVDAAGHLYAFLQAARTGDFTTYTESGKPIKPMETDALAYLAGKGGKFLNIVRINDMDRHSTEIVNGKALSYALRKFSEGYANLIECVSNTAGQKGGTGTAFENPDIHVLTETHENSYPALSRVMDAAMKKYIEENEGRHPAYNAMRQWADLAKTRTVLKEHGGRIVFVPRLKTVGDKTIAYLGVDMPMGDLSFFTGPYQSRMFQFAGPKGIELEIHDMKKKENLPIALRTIQRQLEDQDVLDATKEVLEKKPVAFDRRLPRRPLYAAPAPEFD